MSGDTDALGTPLRSAVECESLQGGTVAVDS